MTKQFIFSTIPKTSSMNTSSTMQMNSKTSQKAKNAINRSGMMNGWGFALSLPYSMFRVFLIPYQ